MNLLTYIQLDDDIQPKPPVKAPVKKSLLEPTYVPIFQYPVIVKRLRTQIMVDSREWEDAGKFIEDHIKHNLTVAMLKELEPHIKVERMQDGFTVYGQTMFVGKLDVIE